jgi:hypothetical protein
MLGVAPHVRQRTRPSLGGEAGGRSPGFISITRPLRQLRQLGDGRRVADQVPVPRAPIVRTRYAAFVMVPPAWLSTITGVSNQLISGSEP